MRYQLLIPGLFITLIATSCFTARKTIRDYHAVFSVIDSNIDRDPAMESLLQPYRLKMDSQMSQVIGYSRVAMTKAQPECTMGNFMADAQLAIAQETDPGVVLSIMNYGGIRIPYASEGPITMGKIYEMMPFDNKLTLIEIPGNVLQEFCDHMAEWGGWPVSGLTYQIRNKKAIHVLVNGMPLKEDIVYLTALSDYIANGGDRCDFLVPCKRRVLNIFVRDMLIAYVRDISEKGEKLNPVIEQRITYAQ